ncbi:MAG: hypothetical protein IPO67_19555 [Deltaproteobacteria bacterium]|nr:hypothetical protein [Deltaproteobacteria bacterium]MBK9364872.1 hypothetical protein [Deltaproteobacteria bacterium]MBK9647323.1 hypothetical protein [Deltaproteobacteria bacterium]
MRILLTATLLIDGLLAAAVFTSLAKPDLAVWFALQSRHFGEEWFEEHVGPDELARLRLVARRGAWLGLVGVFALSALAGAMASVVRLGG